MKTLHFKFCWSQPRSSKLGWLFFPTGPVLRMYHIQESDRRGGLPNVLPSEEIVSRMAFTQQCHVGTKWRLLYGRRIWQLHHHHTGSSYWLPLWRAEKWQKNGESSEPMHFCSGRMEFCTLTNSHSPLPTWRWRQIHPPKLCWLFSLRCWTYDVWVKAITLVENFNAELSF